MSAFDEFFRRAVEHEGKVCEDVPGDRGGPTKWGVTIGRLATIEGVREPKRGTAAFEAMKKRLYALTEAQIKEIYKKDYWDAVRGDDLPPGLAYAVADYGLNSGPARAVKALQKLLGNPQTGKMDDETIREAHAFDRVELIILYCNERQRFLNGIVESCFSQRKFLKGWTTRVGDVRRAAIAMADRAPEPAPERETMPKATEPPVPTQPTVAHEAVRSKSVWSLFSALGLWFSDVGDWLSRGIDRVLGVAGDVQTDVEGGLAPIQSLAGLLKANVGRVVPALAAVLIVVAIARHVRDKRELTKLRLEKEGA